MELEQLEIATVFATGNCVLAEIRDGAKCDDMKGIYELFVLGILDSKHLRYLNKTQKLGVAIVIIGAGKTEYFYLAFRILW